MRILASFFLAGILLLGCGGGGSSHKRSSSDTGMSWTFELTGVPEGRSPEADLELAESLVTQTRLELATVGAGSQISQVNSLAGVRSGSLNRLNYDLILRSLGYKKESRDAVDLLAGPLHRLWGAFDRRDETGLAQTGRAWPSQADLDSTMHLVHDGATYFVDLGVLLKEPGMEIDLEPLLPGVLVDRCLDSLQRLGYMDQLIEAGETWRATGLSASGKNWRVALQLPGTDKVLGEVELKEAALSLVSPRQQASQLGGRETSSLVDPRNGNPVQGTEAAWVLAERAESARAWALALAILGPEAGIELLESKAGVEGALVHHGDTGLLWTASTGFPMARPDLTGIASQGK